MRTYAIGDGRYKRTAYNNNEPLRTYAKLAIKNFSGCYKYAPLFYAESIRLLEEFHSPDRSDGSLQELKLLHQRYERSAYDKLEIAEQWMERNRSEIERRKNAILKLVEDMNSPQVKKAQQV